ncbi:MAG TPA: 7-cyano-7-deazaguanine synthase, partial [Candidatus Deferrimicrobiaceae bacterium]
MSGGAGLPKGIVLASGGMDSLVLAAFATRESEIALLHVNYGQRTERRELECFRAIAEFLQVRETKVVDIGYLRSIGGSALTDPAIEVPEADLSRQGVPVTYVPFRNAHFLAIAVSWAE